MTKSNLPFDLSPKVAAFLAAVGGPGIILLILGIVLDNDDLRTAGLTALGASVVGGGAGYKAKPGDVVEDVGVPSDASLSAEAIGALNDESNDTVIAGAKGPGNFTPTGPVERIDDPGGPHLLPGESESRIGEGAGDPPKRPLEP